MQSISFLSESVNYLLVAAGSTECPSDKSRICLSPQCTFLWKNIDNLLKECSGNLEPSEWAHRSQGWFATAVCSLAPVFEACERLCHRAATTDTKELKILHTHWEWTGNADELSYCLRESFCLSPCPASAVESVLIISAILERALGNLLRQKNFPVPFLLRDLLLEPSLYDIFGDTPLTFTRLLVGTPSGLNARNLVWHGFVAPVEMTRRIPATLLILLASFGEKLSTEGTSMTIPISKTDCNISGLDILPNFSINNAQEFTSMLTKLNVIPPHFLPFWKAALDRFSKKQFGRCLVLLLPQLELVLRIGFCIYNDCPRRLLTATQSSPHTTLDDMLVETLDGAPNTLNAILGEGLLNGLFDFLQRPSGPRIRDRLGHGECALDTVPSNLTCVLLSLSLATATRLSKLASDPFHQLLLWEKHTSLYHPTALLLKSGFQVLDCVEKVNATVNRASALVDHDHVYSDDFFNSLETALEIDSSSTEVARKILHVNPTFLFRPRNEITATVALRRALHSLCVALNSAATEIDRRSLDVVAGRLRSRQRKTLERMIQVTPAVSRGSVCLVVMAVNIRDDVANAPERYTRWQRCINHMEKYTEKLASYAHESKNRWEEIKTLTSDFFEFAVALWSERL